MALIKKRVQQQHLIIALAKYVIRNELCNYG
jgi:hypothetical protein